MSDWAIKSATEALIGMQHDCDAMMKLTKEERDSLLFSVAASLREARDEGIGEAIKLAKSLRERDPFDDEDFGYNHGIDAVIAALYSEGSVNG